MCDDKLLKLQWRIFRLWLEKECLGPGSVFLSPLKIRLSNLVNENLGHDGATSEKLIELLKKAWNLTQNTPKY